MWNNISVTQFVATGTEVTIFCKVQTHTTPGVSRHFPCTSGKTLGSYIQNLSHRDFTVANSSPRSLIFSLERKYVKHRVFSLLIQQGKTSNGGVELSN